MNSEKVKEIKKGLKDHSIEKLKYQDGIKIKEIDFADILTLINELESENKRLSTKIGQILLSIDTVKEMNAMCNIDEQRKQAVKEFAEMLKAKMPCEEIFKGVWDKIDETLKEYGNDTI